MDRAQQKEIKPHQLLPNLPGKFNFLQEVGCADSFENFEEFALLYAESSLKFAQKSVQPFSFQKLNCPANLAIADLTWFLSA